MKQMKFKNRFIILPFDLLMFFYLIFCRHKKYTRIVILCIILISYLSIIVTCQPIRRVHKHISMSSYLFVISCPCVLFYNYLVSLWIRKNNVMTKIFVRFWTNQTVVFLTHLIQVIIIYNII